MHGMSGLQSILSNMLDAVDSEFLSAAGVVLGSCILFIFKSVRETGKKVVSGIRQAVKFSGAKKQHIYNEQINELNEGVEASLMRIGVLTDAARVSVWQFHNGETFTLSKPVFKLRSSFEYDRPGLTPDCTVINDVLVTQCLPLVGPLIDKKGKKTDGVTIVPVNADELPSGDEHRIIKLDLEHISYGSFKYLMEKLGTSVIYATLLDTPAGAPFGIITIQFAAYDEPTETFEPNATKICASLSRIRFALDDTRH